MSFKQKVENNSHISACYQSGLQAMGGYSNKVKAQDTSRLNGSVFLEECLQDANPGESLWDYMVSYGSSVYFIEVHPASSGNVNEMIKKLRWLQRWLKNKATEFLEMKSNNKPYRWISTDGVHITRGSSQARKLASSGLSFPEKVTRLP
jgi:hypothetical protein